jgi:hypothetical protein
VSFATAELVVPGLVPGIHVFVFGKRVWMAGSQASGSDAVIRTAMPGHDEESEKAHRTP